MSCRRDPSLLRTRKVSGRVKLPAVKWRWTITACGLAAAVLLVSVLLGPTVRQRVRQAPAPRPVDEAPPGFESGGEALATGVELTSRVQKVRGYYVRRVSSDGRISEFIGQTLEPLPAGRSRVGQPVVRVHLARGRIIQIAADQAELYAPDNQPQSGVLQGNVRLTLFEADREPAVNLAENSPDVAARMLLDQPVHFDMLAGQIQCDGAVRVASSQMRLRGRGLLIRYDQAQSRINLLQVEHGEELRLSRGTSDDKHGGESPAPQPATRSATVPRKIPVVYRATFENLQEARSTDLLILGERLELIFSLQSGSPGRQAIEKLGAAPNNDAGAVLAHGHGLPALLYLLALAQVPQAQATPATEPSELFAPADDDVVVHWAGQLVVQPYEEAPPDWAAEDVRLRVIGEPVKISDARGPVGSAAILEYSAPSGQVTLTGSPRHALTLQTAEGRLQAVQASIAPSKATGTIQGPGILTLSASGRQAIDQPEGETRLTWRDTLQLTFSRGAAEGAQPAGLASLGRLGGLRTATLLGDAEIERPPYRIRGQRVEVSLSDADGGRQLEKLDAQGGAQAVLSGQETGGGIEAQCLTLTLDNKTADPTAVLEARGAVQASSAGNELHAGWLRVELAQQERSQLARETPAGASRDEAASPLKALGRLRRAQARDTVAVTLADDGLSLVGDRLALQGESGKLELWGTAQQPAQVVSTRKDRGTLSATYLAFDQSSRTAHVPGPGTLSMEVAAGRDSGARRSTIRWQDSMQFDDAKGVGHFAGDVEVLSERPQETTRITGEDLTLELATDAEGQRVLKSAKMRQNVVLLGERRAANNGQLLSRLRLAAETVVFDGVKDQAQVPGPGSLLFEQHAPATDAATSQPARVQFGGKGATLFTWRGDLLLDTRANDLRMRQDVAMDHRPDGEDGSVHLDCQELTADVEGAAGLSAWASGHSASSSGERARLVSVDADRRVRVVYGQRSILADHLHYSGDHETVTLRGDPTELAGVRIYSGDLLSVDAKSVRWYLKQDKYEIIQPGATRVPLR